MSEALYNAVLSRDARFDGRFFTAVLTTGIYCRPVCRARAPRRENVRFYPTAAAAEAAGFRPCLRCRPETSAGTPAWSGTSATVARALRIIDESRGIEHLASRLGITDRHLRRLFEEHVGAPPIAILQTRRLHLARSLLAETSLPVTDIAYGSGFSSIRRFNDSIRKAYHCTPSELRRKRPPTVEPVTIRLPFRPPMRWNAMTAFLRSRAIAGVESFEDGCYVRGEVRIDGELRMTLPPSLARDIQDLVVRGRRMFDLSADPAVIAEHLRGDRVLRPLIRPGTRVPGAWEPFQVAVRAVAGQQISVRAATTIMNRLAPLLTPGQLADADVQGMPRSRAETIRGLARAVADDPSILTRGASVEETVDRLMALRGIGRWTAHYIAMRALGEPDAFPDADLGLRKAAAAIGIEPGRLLAHAERWRPWRAYAAIALWESL
ncbi:MAG TPA: Ada metal-binding domain-containing protein [Thermoanaerobaculia bacterium]|nr:Ada metal-binding domain-containing protein [Thermoanaerobaculia bacterium]